MNLLTVLSIASTLTSVPQEEVKADSIISDTLRANIDTIIADIEIPKYEPKVNSDKYAYNLTLPLTNHGYIPNYTTPTLTDEVERQKANDNRPDNCLPRYAEVYERQLARDAENIQAQFAAINGNPRKFRFARNADYVIPTIDMSQFQVESTIVGTQLQNIPQIEADMNLTMDDLMPEMQVKSDRWHWRGDHSVQMSQTALSSNWYNGGDNNLTINSHQLFNVKRYDEEEKTTFECDMSLKLAAYYTTSDTVHAMKVTDNEFAINIKYGYRAWKKWYYTLQTYAKTELFDHYGSNDPNVKSTWLSPLDVNVSLGLEYKTPAKNKNLNFSLLLAPLSYKLRYVNDPRVNVTSYGIDEDKHSKHDFGSTATLKLDWKITEWAKLSSRIYYFTSYHDVLVEFENTLNIALGRLFSARLYYYPRFDDTVDSRVQTKEILTFGFNYAW